MTFKFVLRSFMSSVWENIRGYSCLCLKLSSLAPYCVTRSSVLAEVLQHIMFHVSITLATLATSACNTSQISLDAAWSKHTTSLEASLRHERGASLNVVVVAEVHGRLVVAESMQQVERFPVHAHSLHATPEAEVVRGGQARGQSRRATCNHALLPCYVLPPTLSSSA